MNIAYFSDIFAWFYFGVNSFSLYFQILLIRKNGSNQGFSTDYAIFNLVEFGLGLFYYTYGFFLPQYVLGLFEIHEILFSFHGFAISLYLVLNIILKYKIDTRRILSKGTLFFFSLLIWGFLNIIFVEDILNLYNPILENQTQSLKFNSIIYIGYFIEILSIIKYIPQIKLNSCIKSTIGISPQYIILNFIGAVFLFTQTIIEDYEKESSFSIVKYFLIIVKLIFISFLIIQHFFLFHKKDSIESHIISNVDDTQCEYQLFI